MFRSKSVVIVGAGASVEAGLPAGEGLKTAIAELLDYRFNDMSGNMDSGDRSIIAAMRSAVTGQADDQHRLQRLVSSARMIRNSMPMASSIDNYIDGHNGNSDVELVGKLAIVRSILAAERVSKLYFDWRQRGACLQHEELKDSWYNEFMKLLTDNCRASDIAGRLANITFIVFNYDRCIEHFLYHSIQRYYGISGDEAKQTMQNLQIFHPYGTVGSLEWSGLGNTVRYGDEVSPDKLLDLARQIKTFTEGTDPNSSQILEIRKAISSASMVLCLGFAFHKINLELLYGERERKDRGAGTKYFATAFGVSNSDCEVIRKELSTLAQAQSQRIALRNELTCKELFGEYQRVLSFE